MVGGDGASQKKRPRHIAQVFPAADSVSVVTMTNVEVVVVTPPSEVVVVEAETALLCVLVAQKQSNKPILPSIASAALRHCLTRT